MSEPLSSLIAEVKSSAGAGNIALACQKLGEALALYGDRPDWLAAQGHFLIALGRLNEAEDVGRRLAALAPSQDETLKLLGQLWLSGSRSEGPGPQGQNGRGGIPETNEKVGAAQKFQQLYERMIGDVDRTVSLGLRREFAPCLIELNGDLLWLPGDLLRFLWHTVRKPISSAVPSFLAETDHYHWIRERISPGDTVMDLGANLGIFSTMMGARVGPGGHVYAFEPNARVASDLRRVVALNELTQVEVVEAAVSNENGEASFSNIEEEDVRREGSRLSEIFVIRGAEGSKHATVTVKTIVLDDFVEKRGLRPSLIKIDVEGAEFLVLDGAVKTIGASHPKLVIEIHPTREGVFDHDRLTAYFRRFGYEYVNIDKNYFCW